MTNLSALEDPMMRPRLVVELCAGTAALSWSLFGARYRADHGGTWGDA